MKRRGVIRLAHHAVKMRGQKRVDAARVKNARVRRFTNEDRVLLALNFGVERLEHCEGSVWRRERASLWWHGKIRLKAVLSVYELSPFGRGRVRVAGAV